MAQKIHRSQIEFQGHVLSYIKTSTSRNSKNVLIALHGFGQSGNEFLEYLKPLEDSYTIYALDHFFHGESNWNSNQLISTSIFRVLISKLFEAEQIDKFEVVAYSLGGKWAYSLVDHFPKQVQKLILCAPDGSKTNFYYDFSSRNPLGRFLFQRSVANPGFYFALLRTALRFKIIPKTVYRFAYFQMDTAAKREQVANTWIKYRKFNGLQRSTIQLINQNAIPLQLVLGAYDSVIQPVWFEGIESKIPHVKKAIVKKGHRTILTEIVRFV